MPQVSKKRNENVWVAATAGVVSGVTASALTCPLDVIKTRMQLQAGQAGRLLYRSTLQSLQKIVVEEGVRGLYHGLWATTVGLTFNWAVYFASYNKLKSSLVYLHQSMAPDTVVNHMAAAVGAGAITATVTSPIWVVKTRYQVFSPCSTMMRKKATFPSDTIFLSYVIVSFIVNVSQTLCICAA